ncbi:MAG TPA: hypothetical protein VHS99_14350 [Chloroflexota bacterium]|nr:hypothetical protein [Chloroflexota bacterium]
MPPPSPLNPAGGAPDELTRRSDPAPDRPPALQHAATTAAGRRTSRDAPRSAPPGPFDLDLHPELRRRLARRLRHLLTAGPLDAGEMAAELQLEPELIVLLLRDLRANPRGRLHTTVRRGHVCWWWQDTKTKESAKDDGRDSGAKKKGKRRGSKSS